MKKKLLNVISVALIVSLLASCGARNEYMGIFDASYSEKNKIFFNFNLYKFTLLTCQNDDFKTIDGKDDIMQYPFLNNNSYFTSGSSSENNFKIIKIENEKIKSIYEVPNKENEAIFPLDEYNGELYFIKTVYDGTEILDSVLCVYQDNALLEFENTRCTSITSGTIIDGKIYYMIYEKNDKRYDIMTFDLNRTNEKAIVYKRDTKSGFLYRYNGELIYTDDRYIYAGDNKYDYEKGDYVSFVDEKSLMIKSSVKQGNMTIKVYDLHTAKLIKELSGAEGIIVDNEKMEILHSDKIETYRWES